MYFNTGDTAVVISGPAKGDIVVIRSVNTLDYTVDFPDWGSGRLDPEQLRPINMESLIQLAMTAPENMRLLAGRF